MKKRDLSIVIIFLKIYLITTCVFTFYRLILFFLQYENIGNHTQTEVFLAFLMGLRFDLVVNGYILLLPFFILTAFTFFRHNEPVLKKTLFYFIFSIFSIAFLVCAADIPFFGQFSTRFSILAFEWMDSPKFVFQMIAQEPRYWGFSILFVASVVIFYYTLKRVFYKSEIYFKPHFSYAKIIISIFTIGIIFLGIRGRIEKKSPIRIGTAFFCNNPFLNNLGLNPNFTLIRSYLDSKDKNNNDIHLIDNKLAINNIQSYLHIQKPDSIDPISREVLYKPDIVKKNVVIVLMESMSAALLKRHGNQDNLTPFLDSISNEGVYFENCYSAGIHTRNGIFSTLFSFPALFRQHPMKESGMEKYPGIASTLKKYGYNTVFFTTHDGQFDNMEGFLKNSSFDQFIEKKDYPSDKSKTALGVPDDFMFEFSIPVINQMCKTKKPFLSVFLTASNHGPYYVPDYFKPHNKEIKKRAVEYADFSLKKFINLAKQQKWFNNTIFVFIADHGAPLNYNYDISLEYLHVPLIFYSPTIIKTKTTFSKMAGQIDVFPSVMSLLKLPFVNHSMGINLFEETRPYVLINADDKFGVLNDKWLLIVKQDGTIKLHDYKDLDLKDYSKENYEAVKAMEVYGESYMQTFQYLINNVYTYKVSKKRRLNL